MNPIEPGNALLRPRVAEADPGARDVPGPAGTGRLARVLFAALLDPSRKFGSIEEQALLLARAFRDRGGLFLPLFAGGHGPDPEAEALYRAEGLPFACLDLRRFRPEAARRLGGLVRHWGIEVVDWNFFREITNGYLWWLKAFAPRVRHDFTDHTSRHGPNAPPTRGLKRLAKRAVCRAYARTYCVSDYVLGRVRDGGAMPDPRRWTLFVNTDRFRPDEAVRAEVRGRLGAGGRFVALTVGQLVGAKGVDVAIRALARLPEPVVLWVVGEGEEADRLRALGDRLGLGDRVRLLGPRRDVAPAMQAADCLICPSRWREAAGLVNLEAMACGLPVVASAIGGIPEFVEDGRTGLLVPAEDEAALAAAVRRLVDDPGARAELGRAARATALERYSPRARSPDALERYRTDDRPRPSALGRPHRPGGVPCPRS